MTATETARLCKCGCGHRLPKSRPNYLPSHKYGHIGATNDSATLDARAIAYFTGCADARYGRARRVDIADSSPIGTAYTRGYNAPEAWRYEQ